MQVTFNPNISNKQCKKQTPAFGQATATWALPPLEKMNARAIGDIYAKGGYRGRYIDLSSVQQRYEEARKANHFSAKILKSLLETMGHPVQ